MHDTPLPDPLEAEDDPLAFTPVPLKNLRHDGWTERRQRDFIAALAAMGSVRHALRAVGKTKQSAYVLRNRPGAESFAAAWDLALLMGYELALGRAMNLAINGVTKEYFYKGKRIGSTRIFNDRILIAALSNRPPNPFAARDQEVE